ncbi:MAG: substrate-binding domain-containing protein [Saprospiraceae bacterium]
MNHSFKLFLLLFAGILSGFNCNKTPNKESSPTQGNIKIFCDEALKNIIEQEEDIFERNYPNAHISIEYISDAELFKHFLNDSSEIIIGSRKLNSKEIEFLDKNKNLHPREFPFAISAVALISASQSKDSLIKYEDLILAIKGSKDQKSKVYVVENSNSSIPNYLMSLAKVDILPSNFYAQKDNIELIDYVSSHPGSVGILDWSRISDSDDPRAKAILSKVNLIKVQQIRDSIPNLYYPPYQYNLQDNVYPFTRTLYFISRSGKNDLGLGFASFITGEIGQRILLKAGLLPLFQTDRWIEIKSGNDPKVIR